MHLGIFRFEIDSFTNKEIGENTRERKYQELFDAGYNEKSVIRMENCILDMDLIKKYLNEKKIIFELGNKDHMLEVFTDRLFDFRDIFRRDVEIAIFIGFYNMDHKKINFGKALNWAENAYKLS